MGEMKKGVLFSVMAFLLAMPFLVLAIAHSQAISGYGEQIASSIRVRSGFYFLQAIKSDLKRSGEIIGRRTALALINHVIETGEEINNSREGYREMFLNGTLNEEEIVANFSTIKDWIDEVEVKSERRGFQLNLTFYQFRVDEDPFELNITLSYLVNLTEASREFSFNKDMKRKAPVSLEGLEDPLFPLNTNGLIGRKFKAYNPAYFTQVTAEGEGGNGWAAGESIKKKANDTAVSKVEDDSKVLVLRKRGNLENSTLNSFAAVLIESDASMAGVNVPYVKNAPGAFDNTPNGTRIVVSYPENKTWDISNLYKMWKEELYVEGSGPSFFQRLENNLTDSDGVETFVKKSELANAGLEVDRNASSVASVYFSSSNPSTYKIKGIPQYFRLDGNHLSFYGCEELTVS